MERPIFNCSMINIVNKYMEENYKLKTEIDKLVKENKKLKKELEENDYTIKMCKSKKDYTV